MNYQFVLNKFGNKLKNKSFQNPFLDTEIILSNILNISREELLLNLNKKIEKVELKKFETKFKKRLKKEPIAYLVGKKEFWKNEFIINNKVLIPRPETELLVEYSLKYFKNCNKIKVLDIGTGSGCIIISLLNEMKNWSGVGLDISREAIKIAKMNAKIQQLENRIKFIHSDIDKFLSCKYDLIVSNPPYISRFDLDKVDEDVRKYEPLLALNGGRNGLSKIEDVIKRSSKLIKTNGKLVLEIGFNQFHVTKEMLKKYGFYTLKLSKDLSGNNRCIVSIKL